MKRLTPLLLSVIYFLATGVGALRAERQIMQVRYEGIDSASGDYVVRVRSNPNSAESREDELGETVTVRFSEASDAAALSVFEKVSRAWILRPAPQAASISCRVVLRLSLIVDQATASPSGDDYLVGALRDWHLEMPVAIRVGNMGDESFFSGHFLVERAEMLWGDLLTPAERARHLRIEPRRVAEFAKEARGTAWTGTTLCESATAERLTMIRATVEGCRPVIESKLRRQVRDLRAAVTKLEPESGGCEVEMDADSSFGLSARVPSLAAAGGPASDHSALFLFVRCMNPEERGRLKAESESLMKESDELKPQVVSLRAKRDREPISETEQALLNRWLELIERLRTIGDIPMARYKDLGLLIGGPLSRDIGTPPTSAATLRAMKAYYRTLSQVVEFYDLPALELEMDELIAQAEAAQR